MSPQSSRATSADRFLHQNHIGGSTSEISEAYDTKLGQTVLLRNTSRGSGKIASNTFSLTPRLLDFIDEGCSCIFVYEKPSTKVEALLVDRSQYSLAEVEQVFRCFLWLFRELNSKGCVLLQLESEDALISGNGTPLLINQDNIIPRNEKDARLRQAHADLARLLMQMSLGCDYSTVRYCVEVFDGQYRIKSLPPSLEPSVARMVHDLLSSPHPTPRIDFTSKMTPPRRITFQETLSIKTRQLTKFGKRSMPLIVTVCVLGVPGYFVKQHYDEQARIALLAKQEVERRRREAILAVQAAERKRDLCLAAIRLSAAGDCRGQDLTGLVAPDTDFSKIQLDGATLQNANLKGSSFTGLTLTEVNFQDANLRSADLSSITSTDVNWNGTDLMNATFESASLKNADFSGTELGEVNLSKANISHANLSGVNLSNQQFVNLTAIGTNFENAFLTGVIVSGGDFTQSNFSRANLSSAIFTDNVLIDEAKFSNSRLASAQFRSAEVRTTTFVKAEMLQVIIEDSTFRGVSFIGSNLESAQFKNSSISGGSFSESTLTDVIGWNSSFRVADFQGTSVSGIFVNCDFYRASYFEVNNWRLKLRNVVLPDGSIENPEEASKKD